MEAQQCVKLSLTNRSIGFDPLRIRDQHPVASSGKQRRNTPVPQPTKDTNTKHPDPLDGLVATAEAPAPDPIPNSEVKPSSADGTPA